MNKIEWLKELITIRSDYRKTFQTPHGERVLRHLCRITGVTDRSGPNQFTMDRDRLLWAEGQRHVVFSILKNLNAGDEALYNQIQEHERNREDEKLDQSNTV